MLLQHLILVSIPRKITLKNWGLQGKKGLLFTAKRVKSRLQNSHYVNTYKIYIRIEISTFNQDLWTYARNVDKRFSSIFTGRRINYRNLFPRDMKDSPLISWCWTLFRHTNSKNHLKILEPKPNPYSEFVQMMHIKKPVL